MPFRDGNQCDVQMVLHGTDTGGPYCPGKSVNSDSKCHTGRVFDSQLVIAGVKALQGEDGRAGREGDTLESAVDP